MATQIKSAFFGEGSVHAYDEVRDGTTPIQACFHSGGRESGATSVTQYFSEAGARAYAAALIQCADAVRARAPIAADEVC